MTFGGILIVIATLPFMCFGALVMLFLIWSPFYIFFEGLVGSIHESGTTLAFVLSIIFPILLFVGALIK